MRQMQKVQRLDDLLVQYRRSLVSMHAIILFHVMSGMSASDSDGSRSRS